MALHYNHEPSRNRFTVNLFIPHTGMCAIYCHPKVDGSVLKTINIVDWLGLRLWPIPMKKNLYTVSFISINRYAHLFILFICTYMSFVGRCCWKDFTSPDGSYGRGLFLLCRLLWLRWQRPSQAREKTHLGVWTMKLARFTRHIHHIYVCNRPLTLTIYLYIQLYNYISKTVKFVYRIYIYI